MNHFLQALVLSVLFLQPSFATEKKDTASITLDEATKKVTENTQSKVLSAKTKNVEGKEVHVIKILTEKGRIQHIKIDAKTGKRLEKSKEKETKDKKKDK